MKRVVAVSPCKEELEVSGLRAKDYRVDPDLYQHHVERFHREFSGFLKRQQEEQGVQGGPAQGMTPGGDPAEFDEVLLEAFEKGLPPYHYSRGSFYRYRIDRSGSAAGPIILESYERDEITVGSPGVDGVIARHSLWSWIVRRIDNWFLSREEKS